MKNFPTKTKREEAENEYDDTRDEDGGGYVIDYLPVPKAKSVKKRDHSDHSDSDYDPSNDAYYQDANFGECLFLIVSCSCKLVKNFINRNATRES